MTIIQMTDVEHKLCVDALRGDKGAVLIDVLTDQLLLKDSVGDSREKVGMGRVIKFLRDLHSGADNFHTTQKT